MSTYAKIERFEVLSNICLTQVMSRCVFLFFSFYMIHFTSTSAQHISTLANQHINSSTSYSRGPNR
jgi:hypothetical protein